MTTSDGSDRDRLAEAILAFLEHCGAENGRWRITAAHKIADIAMGVNS